MGIDALPGWTDGWAAAWPGLQQGLAWWGWVGWPLALHAAGVVIVDWLEVRHLRARHSDLEPELLPPSYLIFEMVVPALLTWGAPPFWSRTALFAVQIILILVTLLVAVQRIATMVLLDRDFALRAASPVWCMMRLPRYLLYARYCSAWPSTVRRTALYLTARQVGAMRLSRRDTRAVVRQLGKDLGLPVGSQIADDFDAETFVTAMVLRPEVFTDSRNGSGLPPHPSWTGGEGRRRGFLHYLAFDGTGPAPDAAISRTRNTAESRLSPSEVDNLIVVPYPNFLTAHQVLREMYAQSHRAEEATQFLDAVAQHLNWARRRWVDSHPGPVTPDNVADLLLADRDAVQEMIRTAGGRDRPSQFEAPRAAIARWWELAPLLLIFHRLNPGDRQGLPDVTLWYDAGIAAEDAKQMIRAGRCPDADTLRAMAALRTSAPGG